MTTPTVVGYICTGTVGAGLNLAETACPTASGPTSVAVDAAGNIYLAGATSAVIDGLCRRLLEDDSAWVQVHAALALGKLGPAAASAGMSTISGIAGISPDIAV